MRFLDETKEIRSERRESAKNRVPTVQKSKNARPKRLARVKAIVSGRLSRSFEFRNVLTTRIVFAIPARVSSSQPRNCLLQPLLYEEVPHERRSATRSRALGGMGL